MDFVENLSMIARKIKYASCHRKKKFLFPMKPMINFYQSLFFAKIFQNNNLKKKKRKRIARI